MTLKITSHGYAIGLGYALVGVLVCVALATSPAPQITLPCVITDVHDGDTVTCEVRIPIQVRLLDCWAPELATPEGRTAATYLRGLAKGKSGVLQIPLDHARRTDDVLTLGRTLGNVWIDGDQKSLSERQIAAGRATVKKPKLVTKGTKR
jgi:endonuclease YncB( thermonuclease family)